MQRRQLIEQPNSEVADMDSTASVQHSTSSGLEHFSNNNCNNREIIVIYREVRHFLAMQTC